MKCLMVFLAAALTLAAQTSVMNLEARKERVAYAKQVMTTQSSAGP